jgi:hypothetical protein
MEDAWASLGAQSSSFVEDCKAAHEVDTRAGRYNRIVSDEDQLETWCDEESIDRSLSYGLEGRRPVRTPRSLAVDRFVENMRDTSKDMMSPDLYYFWQLMVRGIEVKPAKDCSQVCVLWIAINTNNRPSLHLRSQPQCKSSIFLNTSLLLTEIVQCSQTAESRVHILGLTDEIHILLVSDKAAEIMQQCFQLTVRILDLFEEVDDPHTQMAPISDLICFSQVERNSPGADVVVRFV